MATYFYILIYTQLHNMKIIIIEGTDRTGKDTLINELKNLYSHTLIIHCGKPVGKTLDEQNLNQDALFNSYINKLYNENYYGICDLIIFNRAWYGEYVYGTLYRNRQKNDVFNMIDGIEQDIKLFINDNSKFYTKLENVYYVQLINNSTELALKNDDGNSISNDENNIMKETSLFYEIFEKSQLNKKLIVVNDGNKFRDKKDILNEVLDFVNEK